MPLHESEYQVVPDILNEDERVEEIQALSISENFNDDIGFRLCSMVFESDTSWNPAETNESNFNPFPSKTRQLYNKRAKVTKMV